MLVSLPLKYCSRKVLLLLYRITVSIKSLGQRCAFQQTDTTTTTTTTAAATTTTKHYVPTPALFTLLTIIFVGAYYNFFPFAINGDGISSR